VTLECVFDAFGTYAQIDPQTLVTHYGPWLAWLRPTKSIKAAAEMAPPPKEPSPAPTEMAPMMAPQTAQAEPMHLTPPPAEAAPLTLHPPMQKRLVYLASYKKEAMAKKGFSEIKPKSKALDGAKMVTMAVMIPHKGRFVRLFAEVDNADTAAQICNDLHGVIADSCAEGRDTAIPPVKMANAPTPMKHKAVHHRHMKAQKHPAAE